MSEEAKSGITVLEKKDVILRAPTVEDGGEVWKLIKHTGVLDLNSSYSYLMWCTFFSETSIVAEAGNQIVGFVSAFIQPKSPNTIFIWQVAIDASYRGEGLASKLLKTLFNRRNIRNVRYLEATIGPSNRASQALFYKLARDLSTDCNVTPCFIEEQFPEEGHEEELLFRIGPINPALTGSKTPASRH
nr:diaminobutyrate acetyltransferase [Domibacillus mangrovi]